MGVAAFADAAADAVTATALHDGDDCGVWTVWREGEGHHHLQHHVDDD